jgi:uncharacterized protein (DUF1499 family)
MKFIVFIVLLLAVALILAGQLGFLKGSAPSLGVKDGRLKPPSKTQNSVSSQADLYPDHPQKDYAAIAPFTYTGDGEAAMAKLADILQKSERTTVITRGQDYVYAQCTTKVLKFTDDLELWLDKPNKVIQVRSSSRLGAKDFGVNRQRIEALRVSFSAAAN